MKSKYELILNYLKPSMYVRSFKDININALKDQGIKLLISDLDNTLVPHYTRFPNKDVLNFIENLNKNKIQFAIISNNTTSRVRLFSEKAGVENYMGGAKKPLKSAVVRMMKSFNATPRETIFMGDQLLMDILVANRVKCESILVQPLISTDYNMSKVNIFLEKKIYEKLDKNNIFKKSGQNDNSLDSSFELL